MSPAPTSTRGRRSRESSRRKRIRARLGRPTTTRHATGALERASISSDRHPLTPSSPSHPMKPRYLLPCVLVMTMPFTGCQSSDQLLDVVSPTTVSNEIFWTQENDAILFVTGTYSSLPGWFDVMAWDGLTDNGAVN